MVLVEEADEGEALAHIGAPEELAAPHVDAPVVAELGEVAELKEREPVRNEMQTQASQQEAAFIRSEAGGRRWARVRIWQHSQVGHVLADEA